MKTLLVLMMTGTLAYAAHSKTKIAEYPDQKTADFTAGTANEPATINEMKHAPDLSVRTTRTAGRNQDPDTGMAAPVQGSVVKGMRENAYTNPPAWNDHEAAMEGSDRPAYTSRPTKAKIASPMTEQAAGHVAVTTGSSVSYCKDARRTGSRSNVKASDQPQNRKDVETTRQVRRELMARKELSVSAHNLTVVSENCLVTLRGTVPSVDEKSSAEQIARSVAGVSSVNNLIQVAR